MNQSLAALYRRYRTIIIVLAGGLAMVLSFLWYLPGAYHAASVDEYHNYSWREFRFNNVIDMYVAHNLERYDGPGFILGGTGIEYPALLSALIRATAGIGLSTGVPIDVYRSGSPDTSLPPQDTFTPLGTSHGSDGAGTIRGGGNVPAYLLLNYAMVFVFGLLALRMLAEWPGARPWLFAASPILLLYAGYNWDLIPIALTLAGVLLLMRSTAQPNPGRGYNLLLEVCGFALLTVAVWFKFLPIVFLGAALIDRMRRGLWQAAGLGVGSFLALSIVINVPLILSNFQSWYFFLWVHQNRPTEPSSIWYLLFGSMDPALTIRPDTTAAINAISLLVVLGGGLALATVAWRSPRTDILLPLGCLLLLWWFTFNKLYDPNFDLWVLFALAVLGAPLWLKAAFTPLSLSWYVTAIGGLGLATLNLSLELNVWYVRHVLVFMIILRLVMMAILIIWAGRVLLTAAPQAGRQPAAASAISC